MRAQDPKPGFTSWNPLTGCTKISPGCKHCFAERIAGNLQRAGVAKYANGFQLTLHGDDVMHLPLALKRPTLIFVNSMADIFHKDVSLDFIRRVYDVIAACPRHRFMIITKRADRAAELAPDLPWPSNLWLGVSVENADCTWRIDCLRQIPAAARFLSCEPLLGPLPQMDLTGIDSVGCGAETGPDHRRCEPAWVRLIRDHCIAQNVPFGFFGWGSPSDRDGARDRLLDGRKWSQHHAAYDAFMSGGQLGLFG